MVVVKNGDEFHGRNPKKKHQLNKHKLLRCADRNLELNH